MKQQNDCYLEASRSQLSSSKYTAFQQQRSKPSQQILTTADNLDSQKQCRICLEGTDRENDPLVAPCHCTGTLKYVHQQCFKKWVGKMLESKSSEQKDKLRSEGFQCELCKHFLNISFTFKTKCSSTDHFCLKFKQSPFFTLCFLFFFVINAICIGLLINTIVSSQTNYSENPVPLVILLLCAVAVLGVEIAMIVKFVKIFCCDHQVVIDGFALKPGPPSKTPTIISLGTRRRPTRP